MYPSDITMPGMLYGAILRSPHPHARVKYIDTKKAEKMPGVMAMISSQRSEADIYRDRSGETGRKLFKKHCRFEGADVRRQGNWRSEIRCRRSV